MTVAGDIAEQLMEAGVAPAAAAGCAARDPSGVWVRATFGRTGSYFDLASVTKPMTALAIAQSGIDRHSPLGVHLPSVVGTASAEVPLELFLAHRAGLLAHMALWSTTAGATLDGEAALRRVADAR